MSADHSVECGKPDGVAVSTGCDMNCRGWVTAGALRPPVDETRKALERGARLIAMLLARRRRHMKRVEELDRDLSQARKLLRDVIRGTAVQQGGPAQASIDDEL